jgi:hypothetical protein
MSTSAIQNGFQIICSNLVNQQRLKYIIVQVAMLVCRKRNMGDSAHDTASCIEMRVMLGIENRIVLNEGCSIKVNRAEYCEKPGRLGALLLQHFG